MSDSINEAPNGVTILLVDDTPANLAVVVENLEEYGFRVLVAQDGEEALQRAQFTQPDLVLLDVMMPGIDGFEVCRRLKRNEATRDIPVIFMTALADTDSKVSGFAAGAVDYITKPLETAEVLWRIHTHLALRAMQAKLAAQNLQLQNEVVERQEAQAALHQAYAELEESEDRYRQVVELSPDAILIECEGGIVFANEAALRLYGANRLDELQGRPLLTLVAPPGRPAAEEAMAGLAPGHCRTEDEFAQRLDGECLEVAVTRVAFTYRGSPAIQMVARDISEHKRFASQLRHQATHDALTGLPNRALLMDRLHQAISLATRHGEQFVVAFIDLDRFKWINDSLGHEAGDELLKVVSTRMSACLRESDTLARLGGDEFVVLLQDIEGVNIALQIMRRVVSAASEPLVLGGREVAVTCSIGCSTFPEDGQRADDLLKAADTAMYRAKEKGRNNLEIYSADLRHRIEERLELETDLRRALSAGEVELAYQPQVDLKTGQVVCLEAVLRWQHPRFGPIDPERIITLAEESSLIDRLGEWMLRTACNQAQHWRDPHHVPVRLAVELSAAQLERSDLEEMVAACLGESGLDPARLELVLSETASMSDPDKAIEVMHGLRALGIGLSLDKFGVGYSNMHYLKRFPINRLKLDGSFVAEITRDPDNLAIADAIISMAHRLGQKVVAENIDTEGQLNLLAGRGCDQGQGSYFSQALTGDDCIALLERGAMPTQPVAGAGGAVRTILILDDEPNVTAALRRTLRPDGYRMLIAHHADEAFELLATHPVGVILSDQRMPDTTGVEFLSRTKRMYPDTVRLMLSAHRDFEAAADAINRGAVHKFMLKPWDAEDLRQVVAEAFELHERQTGLVPRPA